MTRRELLALAATSVVAAASGFAAWHGFGRAAQRRPELSFRDLDGRTRSLAEWDGKLLLLNFWATWCAPCVKEIPLLVEAQQEFGPRGLQLVGIAMDQREPVAAFAQRLRINYPLLVGEADVVAAMDALGDELGAFPFSVLVAPDGRILSRHSGDLSREEIRELLSKHLPG
ncbi:MAG TPA: TlpA disulfide reductase family protein [Verrucomicrobiae bacterium]|nr:TlpA disulfide reductase family protein [Verrucomicrobiae bacterium]